MNEIDLKELFKVPVETLREKTIRSLLEADITYQNDCENEGIAELNYLQLDLTEEQREVCNRLLECRDKDDCEFLIAGKLSFIYHGMKQQRVPDGTMRHIPYGYRIENGWAVIDEEQAAAVRKFFQNYISGLALVPAAEKAGLKLYHGSAGRMLRNKKYLGDDYYPSIINKETFDKAEEIRMSRAKALGRVWELEGKKDILFSTNFTIPAVKKVSDDPFEQAAYAYSLSESEVDMGGTE